MVISMLPAHIPEVIKLHQQVLGYTLNAKLGDQHLDHLYRVILQEKNNGLALVSIDDNGRVTGFISACRDLKKLERSINKSFNSANFIRFIGYFLFHPFDVVHYLRHALFTNHLHHHYSQPLASILTLGVDNHRQRGGIGRNLIDELISRLKDFGVRTLYVDTVITNNQAISFYKKQNFIAQETVQGNLILARSIVSNT